MRLTLIMLLAVVALRCGEARKEAAPVAAAAPAATSIQEAGSPAPEGAAEPFLFATAKGPLLCWLESVAGTDRHALRFSRYDGARWSEPLTVVERNDLFVNWADFPSVVEDANGALYAHWLQKSGAKTYAYDVRMATSNDGGATWGEPFLLNRDGVQSEHGFATMAPLPAGGVGVTWLDGRNMKGGEHEHDGGDMTLRYATVDADGKIESDVELDPRTCECCTTGMAMTSGGPVIAYRDRSEEEIRDVSLVRRDGETWTKPVPLHPDGWKIAGCPVNGPQVDAIGSNAVVAWFTSANDQQPRVYAKFSADSGATFGEPVVVSDGKPLGRVDVVMLDDETAVVSWLEQGASAGEIRARRISRGAAQEPSVKIADSGTARATGFTRMISSGREVWFAWTEQGEKSKRIRVARGAF